jgi:hypothetical protein
MTALQIYAGPKARKHIEQHGQEWLARPDPRRVEAL